MNNFVVVQSVSHVQLFITPWTAACQAPLSFTIFWSLLILMSIESMMSSNHFILYCPLLLLPSIFPSIRVFSNQSVLPIRWPKYCHFSFSISPSKEYSRLISLFFFKFKFIYFNYRLITLQYYIGFVIHLIGLTNLISLLSKGLSRVFSNTTDHSINSLAVSLLYGPTLTSVHDYWKNQSFDYTGLCQESNVSAY